jgi:predicted nucleic acid-binding protein
MTEVFVDTFHFLALINPTDQLHAEAIRLTRTLVNPPVTTTAVLIELADALSRPMARQVAHRFLANLAADPRIRVVVVDDSWYARGLALFGKRPDKAWSLTDCISFEVMSQRGIVEALTGDHHFRQAGFLTLYSPVP